MNTQFNSNVIWLQLEYKISTLKVWVFEILEAKFILEYVECVFIHLKLIPKLKTLIIPLLNDNQFKDLHI